MQALNETLLLMNSTAFKALSIKANVSVTPQERKFANQRHLPTKMLKLRDIVSLHCAIDTRHV